MTPDLTEVEASTPDLSYITMTPDLTEVEATTEEPLPAPVITASPKCPKLAERFTHHGCDRDDLSSAKCQGVNQRQCRNNCLTSDEASEYCSGLEPCELLEVRRAKNCASDPEGEKCNKLN